MRKTTLISYADRHARVMRHIACHLDARLSLEDLSEVAALSPFHFHRVYRAMQGETTAQTVRRLRLHRAAAALIETERPVARIATEAGYGSVEAFTRAFGADYGLSPAAYRMQRALILPRHTVPLQESTMYEVTLKRFPGARLAVMPHKGSYQKIGGAFEQLSAWMVKHGMFGPETKMIGVYLDDPEAVAEADLRSYAGFSVPGSFNGIDGVEALTLQAGDVAAVVHKGPYAELPRAYAHLYSQWLPSSGREPADQPCFELYLNNPSQVPPTEWLTEVALPLKM